MSREIKFRAWYMPFGNKGRMQKMQHGLASDILGFAEMSPDKYIVEQYTGLRDKYETEISEGDIVSWNNNPDDLSVVKFGNFGVPIVDCEEYVDCAVGFYFEPQGSLKDVAPFNMTVPVNALYSKKCMIVGNVHEDRRLLEADK